jgi:hypothetical protein
MLFNVYKLRHFYINKYILSNFNKKRYHITYDYKHKAIWFRTYKVASRTIDNMLKKDCSDGQYIYGSAMSYSPSMFKNFFKFAFVRNPETRFISAWKDKVLNYNYFNFEESRHAEMKNLDTFIGWVKTLDINNCDEHLASQNSLIDIDNIDFIGKIENFDNDFQYVLDKLSIKTDQIVRFNQGIKKDKTLSADQKKEIYNIYKKDFQLFYPDHEV